MKKYLLIGSIYTDLVSHVDHLPKGNEDFSADQAEIRTDGTGFRNAYVFSKFGFDYDLIAPVGEGIYGDRVKEDCDSLHIPYIEDEDIAGCTYRLIDCKDEECFFCAPGCEYNYQYSYAQNIDFEDIDTVVVYGDMFTGDGGDDLLASIEDFEKPFWFIPTGRLDEMDPLYAEEILKLKPFLFMTDTEAYYLSNEHSKDLKETAQYFLSITEKPVLIFKNCEGVYYADSEEVFFAPESHRMNPIILISAYLAATYAGVDKKNSLMFAVHFASIRGNDLPTDFDFEEQKHRLVGMITHK